jgi:hypothetical protein
MEVEKMKRFFSVCFLVIFSILLTPSISTKYNALAGRMLQGGAAGEECDCRSLGPPDCYDEGSPQPCNGNQRSPQEPTNNKSKPTDVDAGSLGLLFLTALCLFRRFI